MLKLAARISLLLVLAVVYVLFGVAGYFQGCGFNRVCADSESLGIEAEDLSTQLLAGYTVVAKDNPAEFTGTINKAEIWMNTATDDLRIGIFYVIEGNTLKCRDSESVGSVEIGYADFDVSLEVEPGDYIGYWSSTGLTDMAVDGVTGGWYFNGEGCVTDAEIEYGFAGTYLWTIYGWDVSGEEEGDAGLGVTVFTLYIEDDLSTTVNWTMSENATGVQLSRCWEGYPAANTSKEVYTGNESTYSDNWTLPRFLWRYYSIYEYNDNEWSSGNFSMIGGDDLDVNLNVELGFVLVILGCVLLFVNFFLKNPLIYLAILACWFGVYIQADFRDTWLGGVAIIIMIFAVFGFAYRLLVGGESRY